MEVASVEAVAFVGASRLVFVSLKSPVHDILDSRQAAKMQPAKLTDFLPANVFILLIMFTC
jgi:hypothetical protein